MRILPHKDMREYKDNILQGNIDACLTDDIDKCGEYTVGQHLSDGRDVVGLFRHNESDSAWMVTKCPGGQLIEEDIPYSNDVIVFASGSLTIPDLEKLKVGITYPVVCVQYCCNNFRYGEDMTLERMDDDTIRVDGVADVNMKSIAGCFIIDDSRESEITCL